MTSLGDTIIAVTSAAAQENPQIAEWWERYHPSAHETQVNVDEKKYANLYPCIRKGKASRRWLVPYVDRGMCDNLHGLEELGEYYTHDDGRVTTLWDGPTFEVGNIRIPYGSQTDNPTFRDYDIDAPIHHHWHRIGTSSWNWRDKCSEWVGYDFDAICKSKNGNGLTPDQLTEIKNRVREVPWVIVRTSTGGKGLHLLVPVNNPPIARNHDAHAEFAEHVLGRLSQVCDFPFAGSVDVYGRILWHYSKEVNADCLKRLD